MRTVLIIILFPFFCNGQFNINYFSKCDQIEFRYGTQDTDTVYQIHVDTDSMTNHDVNFYYVPYTKYLIEPEDCDTPSVGEIIVDIDSLIATPDTITLEEMYLSDEWALDYYAALDSTMYIADEDLDTTIYYNYKTDTNYVTILQLCDTCTQISYNCLNPDDCIAAGWTCIADSVIDNNYRLGLGGSGYTTYLFIMMQNTRTSAQVWQYLKIVPRKKVMKFNNAMQCKNSKIFYTNKHIIYSNSCSFEL